MIDIYCVLHKSETYNVDYVDRLQRGLERFALGARLVCLSDCVVPCERIPLKYDWPGWWSKMELFRPDVPGSFLYIDLDTIPVGDMTAILSVTHLTMLRDFYHPERRASGVMYLPMFARRRVWDAWSSCPDEKMKTYQMGGDQLFLASVLGDHAQTWQDVLPGQVVSYKEHVLCNRFPRGTDLKGTVPENARLVCFHGKPRPRDVGWRL
jgi:hypothetical protein